MTASAQALRPPSRTLLLLEGRAVQELGAFMLMRPWLGAAPRGDGHPVLVFPGLLASDFSTRPLRGFLGEQGYAVHGWEQGRNLGLRPGVEDEMLERVEALYDRHGGRTAPRRAPASRPRRPAAGRGCGPAPSHARRSLARRGSRAAAGSKNRWPAVRGTPARDDRRRAVRRRARAASA